MEMKVPQTGSFFNSPPAGTEVRGPGFAAGVEGCMDLARIPITDRNSVMINTVIIKLEDPPHHNFTTFENERLSDYFFFLNCVSTDEPMVASMDFADSAYGPVG